jgi:hypothetical protein
MEASRLVKLQMQRKVCKAVHSMRTQFIFVRKVKG